MVRRKHYERADKWPRLNVDPSTLSVRFGACGQGKHVFGNEFKALMVSAPTKVRTQDVVAGTTQRKVCRNTPRPCGDRKKISVAFVAGREQRQT